MFLEYNGSDRFLNRSAALRADFLDFQTELEPKSGNDSPGRHLMTNHWEHLVNLTVC